MPAETPDPTPTPTPTPEPPDPSASGVRLAVTQDMAALRDDLVGRMAALEARGPGGSTSPLARWSTLADYLGAAMDSHDTSALFARALVDQVTGDNPGVMAPSYLTDVFGIIARTRPAITATGGPKSLGNSGMELNWPYFDGSLAGLVAKQTAEKTDIVSVKVSIKNGTSTIATFAGGSDVSYQLIRRSRPSYLEAYGRIMSAAWSLVTDAQFVADLLAKATGTVIYDPLAADATGSKALAAFFAASLDVKRATGAPASVALAASDAYAALGSNPAFLPSAYGTTNLAGTAQASTLRVNISGLDVIEEPALPAGSMVWLNDQAAGWHEDGPFWATAEDVAKLGQNRAIWSMGATGVYLPAGIVRSAASAGAQRSSK